MHMRKRLDLSNQPGTMKRVKDSSPPFVKERRNDRRVWNNSLTLEYFAFCGGRHRFSGGRSAGGGERGARRASGIGACAAGCDVGSFDAGGGDRGASGAERVRADARRGGATAEGFEAEYARYPRNHVHP